MGIGAGSKSARAKRLKERSSGEGPGDVEDLILWQVQQIEKAIIDGKATKAERAADCFPLRRAKTVANFEVQISIARQFHKAKGHKKQETFSCFVSITTLLSGFLTIPNLLPLLLV